MEEREVKDFYFRQLRKVSIGDPAVAPELRYSLLCASNEFGLTFVGYSGGVYVFETSVLYAVDQDVTIGPRNAIADVASLKATLIPTPVPPLHVSLSCDSLTLCVALRENSTIKCLFYDTRAIALKGVPITPFATTDLSTQQDVHLLCLQWNPASPDILAVSLSNRLCLLQVKEDVTVTETNSLGANSVCWSPKGKQLAVGLKDGGILQLSPKNLEQKKSFPCPDMFGGDPQQVSDLHWVSTYMFAVVYTPLSPTDNMPSFVLLSAPKGKPPEFVNCEDVYYGTGSRRKFYFTYITRWEVLVSSSANAVEAVVFAHRNDSWEKWELEDTGRVEMPLDQDKNETFVAGMTLDLTAQQEVVINTNTSLPPAPLLLLYSDRGILCPYFVVNTGCPPSDLIKPPNPLPSGPVRQPTGIQPQSRAPQKPQLDSQPRPLLSGGSMPFTPVYSQPSTSGFPPQNVGSQLSVATSGTSKLGPSPLTTGGSIFGGNKLGSTSATQPSFSQFSVGALTSANPNPNPPYATSTTVPQSRSSSQPPASQPPPNVSLPKAMQLPPALNTINQSFQLGQLQMPPLYSSTPVAPLPMAGKPPAVPTSGGPLQMAATKTTSGLQPQHQPRPPLPSVMPPPTQPGATRFPPTQTGATRVPPLTQLGAAMHPPPSLVPQLTQPGATRLPPPSLVPQLTQPGAARLPPPVYQPAAPPVSASKQPSPKPPPKMTAQDDAESVDASVNVELIDASFSQNIQDEIEGFAEELDSLNDDFRDVLGEWEGVMREEVEVVGLGTMEDLQQLREETQEVESAVHDTTKKMKEIERNCDHLGDDTLRGFELSEEAKANLKKKNDANYVSLLKLRPLDAYNARRLTNIRSSFLQIDERIGEVNSQLDAEMERRYEDRRQRGRTPMKSPSVQTIYYSLRTNRKIARMQGANVERLTNKMKRLKLIPQSWHPADVVSATSPTAGRKPHAAGTPPGAERLPRGEPESPMWKTISADKSETLRDYLSAIEHVPVRRVKSTRFMFSSHRGDQSGVSAPQEANVWSRSGTATPYSVTEGPASVPDSERASVVHVDEHVPTSLPSSEYLRALILPRTGSLRSLQSDSSIHAILTKDQNIKVATSEGYKLTASPSRTQQAPPTVVQSDTSVGVNLLTDQNIEVAATDGYKLATSPSRTQQAPPITVRSGTVHWGGSPPTQLPTNHLHTLTWGMPPTCTALAPKSQQPSLSLSPQTSLSSLPLGSMGAAPTPKSQQPPLSLSPQTSLSSLPLGSMGAAPTPTSQQPPLSLSPQTSLSSLPLGSMGAAPAPKSQQPSLSLSPQTSLSSLPLGSIGAAPAPKSQQPSLSLSPQTSLSSLPLGSMGAAPTPKSQQPPLSLAPPAFLSSAPLGSESGLRRTVPLNNLTRIQASSSDPGPSMGAPMPQATTAQTQSVAATKSEMSKLLFSTSSSLTTTSSTLPSSVFSFNMGATKPLTLGNSPFLSANPAMTIKPAGIAPAAPSGLSLFSATPSLMQQKAPTTAEPPSTTVVTTTTSFSSVFANLPTFSGMTMTNFASLGGSSSTSPFQFGSKAQPSGAIADTSTEKNAPKVVPFKAESKPPSTTMMGSTSSGNFLGSLPTPSLPASTKPDSSTTVTTVASSTGFIFGGQPSSLKLSSLSSPPFKPPGITQLLASRVTDGKEEDSESKGGESEAESTGTASKDTSPGSENPPDPDAQELDGDRQLGLFTPHKMSSEGDPLRSASLMSKPPSGFGKEPLSLVPPLNVGGRAVEGAVLEEGESAEDQESATADPAGERKEQTEPKVATVEQTTRRMDQINTPLSHPVGSQPTEEDNEPPEHGDEKSTDVGSPVGVHPPTLPPPSVAKEPPPGPLPSSLITSLAATIPTHTPGTSTGSTVTAPAAQVQVSTTAAGEKATEVVVKKAESEDIPSDSQTQIHQTSVTEKQGVELKSSPLSMPASQLLVAGGMETKQQQQQQQQQQQKQGGALTLLAQQFAGSQDSLQSATGEEQEMEEMTGVMDNDMEPLDSTAVGSEQPRPQPSGGGFFGLSFGGLGGKASNPSANPFGTPLSSSPAVPASTTASTFLNRSDGGGSSVIKPASGSFGQSPQRGGLGVGVGMSGTPSQFGASPGPGRTTMQGPSFGSGPTFGSGPGLATFGSPPILGTGVPTDGLGGRLFGQGSITGSGGLFQSSGTASELTFGNLAQQPSQGFGAGGDSGFGANIPVTGQSQFQTWR